MKNNTNYFSHDGNAHEDMKCLELKMKHGLEGYGLYRELVERLFNEGGKLMLSKNEAIAYQLHIPEQTFSSIFSTLLSVGLFMSKDDEYRSDSLLKRINIKEEIKKKRMKAGRQGGIAKSKQKLANAKQNSSNALVMPSNKIKLNKIKDNIIIDEKEKELQEYVKRWNSVEPFGISKKGLPKIRKISIPLLNEWKKKRKVYEVSDIIIATENYIKYMRKLKPAVDGNLFHEHRFDMSSFFIRKGGLDKYINM